MLVVDSKAGLLTDAGPLVVADAKVGSKVWVLRSGVRDCAKISTVEHDVAEGGVWVYSTYGDIIIGETSSIVTSDGPRSGQQLLAQREKGYGYMDGSWPRLELFHPSTTKANRNQSQENVRLIDLVSKPRPRGGISIRIGTHAQKGIKKFIAKVCDGEASVEHGPSGWSWISAPGLKSARRASLGAEEVITCWRRGPEDMHVLPIAERDLRQYTTAWLANEGAPFATDYRPRYAPSEVSIELSAEAKPFGEIRGVVAVSEGSLSRLFVAERGVYLVVGGLLCSC